MECPSCGAYNPEDRIQCWKCDDLLPTKREERPRRDQQGRMGMWTWLILILLGAVWFFTQCNGPIQQPTSRNPAPSAIVRPLISAGGANLTPPRQALRFCLLPPSLQRLMGGVKTVGSYGKVME